MKCFVCGESKDLAFTPTTRLFSCRAHRQDAIAASIYFQTNKKPAFWNEENMAKAEARLKGELSK